VKSLTITEIEILKECYNDFINNTGEDISFEDFIILMVPDRKEEKITDVKG